MMVPLMSSGLVIGTLALMSTQLSTYAEEHLRLAEQAGIQISGAVANARPYSERQRAENEISALAAIGRVIGSSLNIDEVCQSFGEQVSQLIPFDFVDVVLVGQEPDELGLDYRASCTSSTL